MERLRQPHNRVRSASTIQYADDALRENLRLGGAVGATPPRESLRPSTAVSRQRWRTTLTTAIAFTEGEQRSSAKTLRSQDRAGRCHHHSCRTTPAPRDRSHLVPDETATSNNHNGF